MTANGSELVLFDVNRSVKFGPLLRPNADVAISRILPSGPQTYRTVIITNRDDMHGDMIERVIEAGGTSEQTQALGLSYPDGLFSLSHVAIPFPMSDALYGMTPDKSEDFGLSLGTLAPRGERNVLVVSLDALLRASSNPFFPYLLQRIADSMPGRTESSGGK